MHDALLIKINNKHPHRMHKHIKKDYGSREPYLENKSIKNRLKSLQPHTFLHLFPIMQLPKMRPMSSIRNKNLDFKNEDVAELGNGSIHVYYGRVFFKIYTVYLYLICFILLFVNIEIVKAIKTKISFNL